MVAGRGHLPDLSPFVRRRRRRRRRRSARVCAGRLDHLAWLGVDALWLSPIYRSPMADFGYDVSRPLRRRPDLRHPRRRRRASSPRPTSAGLRVLLDCVPNHTSIEHPWFAEHPDRYVWRDGRGPDGAEPPNNWIRAFPWPPRCRRGPATPAPAAGTCTCSSPSSPTSTGRNPERRRGHARRPAVLARPRRRRVPHRRRPLHRQGPGAARRPARAGRHPPLRDPRGPPHPRTRAASGALLDSYPTTGWSVGEVCLRRPAGHRAHRGLRGPDELHLAFDFTLAAHPLGRRRRVARGASRRIDAAYADDGGRWPTWAFGNHDNPRPAHPLGRHRGRGPGGGGPAARRSGARRSSTPARSSASRTPVVPPERAVDPGGRDGCRAPMPWTTAARPRLGAPTRGCRSRPRPSARSVEAQRADQGSVLWLYKRLLAARQGVAGAAPRDRCACSTAGDGGSWPGSEQPTAIGGCVRGVDHRRRRRSRSTDWATDGGRGRQRRPRRRRRDDRRRSRPGRAVWLRPA